MDDVFEDQAYWSPQKKNIGSCPYKISELGITQIESLMQEHGFLSTATLMRKLNCSYEIAMWIYQNINTRDDLMQLKMSHFKKLDLKTKIHMAFLSIKDCLNIPKIKEPKIGNPKKPWWK